MGEILVTVSRVPGPERMARDPTLTIRFAARSSGLGLDSMFRVTPTVNGTRRYHSAVAEALPNCRGLEADKAHPCPRFLKI